MIEIKTKTLAKFSTSSRDIWESLQTICNPSLVGGVYWGKFSMWGDKESGSTIPQSRENPGYLWHYFCH